MTPTLIKRKKFFFIATALVLGCASARVSQVTIDNAFRDSDWSRAISELETGLKKEGDGVDQLLFLMDLGLVHRVAGNFQESNRYFQEADKTADLKDYTSLSTEASTLLVSDNITQYKGEDFENVLISEYMALNYAALGDWEGTLVETKRVNHKLYRMKTEGKRSYDENPFAHYLTGAVYEAMGEPDNAYVSYKRAYALRGDDVRIREDGWRMSVLLGLDDDRERWEKDLGWSSEQAKARAKDAKAVRSDPEVVVIFENGIGPEKRPNPNFVKVPQFFPRYNPIDHARVTIDGVDVGRTTIMDDIEATAIATLDEKYSGIVAKKIAGVVAKEVAGEVVARQTDSPLLGFITKIALHAADQADLRHWKLLPKNFQVLRVRTKPGPHVVKVFLDDRTEPFATREIQSQAKTKTFLAFRSVP